MKRTKKTKHLGYTRGCFQFGAKNPMKLWQCKQDSSGCLDTTSMSTTCFHQSLLKRLSGSFSKISCIILLRTTAKSKPQEIRFSYQTYGNKRRIRQYFSILASFD